MCHHFTLSCQVGGAAGTVTLGESLAAGGLVFAVPGSMLPGTGPLSFGYHRIGSRGLSGGSTSITTDLTAANTLFFWSNSAFISPTSRTITAVPELSGLALLVVGGLAGERFVRRRRGWSPATSVCQSGGGDRIQTLLQASRRSRVAGVPSGFSYVGVCQPGSLYSVMMHLLTSRRSRGAQALPQPERSESAGGPWCGIVELVLTSRRPRGGHSAIRDREDMPRSHEIAYGRIGAHSHSRDLAVEVMSHKTRRATEPRVSPRGPVITQSSGRDWIAALVRFVLSLKGPHQDQKFSSNGHSGGLLAGGLGDPQPGLLEAGIAANGRPGRLL